MDPEALYRRYHRSCHLEFDPLLLVRRFVAPADREIAGLTASALAYGRVEQINASLEKVFKVTGPAIRDFTMKSGFQRNLEAFAAIKHRFNPGRDIALLFTVLQTILSRSGTVEAFFLEGQPAGAPDIATGLDSFSSRIRVLARTLTRRRNPTFDYLFPSPADGSACKRLCLFLRWMVRPDDGVDLGLWKGLPPSKLIIPVDTHIARNGRRLKLTRRKNPDWKMAIEITESLRRHDPLDPVKYDFAICCAGKFEARQGAELTSACS